MTTSLSSLKLSQLDIFETVSNSLELFKKKPVHIILVTFIGTIVSVFSVGILLGLVSLNLFTLVKKIDTQDQTPEVPQLFNRLDRLVDSLILLVICIGFVILILIPFAIIGAAGSILASVIISGVTSIIFVLAFQILEEDEGTTPLEAFRTSFDIWKNSLPKVLILGIILGALAIVPTFFTSLLSFPLGAIAQAFNLCIARVIYRTIAIESDFIDPSST